MTLQNVKLEELQAPASNPRKAFNTTTLEGLADSIKTDGVLQNLVVVPINGKSKKKGENYRIISGERRFRALKILEERGEIANDFDVPVEIRTDLSKDDSLRIAAIENLQREALSPVEEAKALAKLITKGTTLEELVSKTGLSSNTIKRRCSLNNLTKEGKNLLSDDQINLSQAEALSLGSTSQQEQMVEHISNGCNYDTEEIKDVMIGELPNVSMAVFPLSSYTGSYTTDLFGKHESTFFDDREQFLELQREGVKALYDFYIYNVAWVDITENFGLNSWQYKKAEKGDHYGVLINFSPSGEVEIKENLAKPEAIDPLTAEETADNPVASKKEKPEFSRPICEYIAYHKTLGVQADLLSNPRKAKELAVARLLASGNKHKALSKLVESANPQSGFETVDAVCKGFAEKLGIKIDADKAGYAALLRGFQYSGVSAYKAVSKLTDEELEELHLLLSVLPFGQEMCDELDTRDSLFNRVAKDIKVNMLDHWQPDIEFLGRRNKEQCLVVSKACGYSAVSSLLGGCKKSDLVNALLKHFAGAREAKKPNKAQKVALNWLPDAFLFPSKIAGKKKK